MSERYLRQEALAGFGSAGQERLGAAHVAVIGAGGLGSPALLYLAAAGVGRITLVDDDVVDLSNLHRQVIHTTARVGELKAESAAQAMRELNPEVHVDMVGERLSWDNALDVLEGCDVVVDGTDNFDARHVVSHACARLGVPHIWASILGFEAQMTVFWAGRGPIYEDLFPTPPAPGTVPSCAQAGVLGPVVGVVGSAMAMEALKIIASVGKPLVGRLGYYDSLSGTWEYVPVVGSPAVLEAVRAGEPPRSVPAVDEVDTPVTGSLLIDVREPDEFATGALDGAVNVPLSSFSGSAPAELVDLLREHAGEPVTVYCAGGVRSAQAIGMIPAELRAGVVSLRGGLSRFGL